MSEQLEILYLESCLDELKVNKPGNHSLDSKIMGMYSDSFYLFQNFSKFLVKNFHLGK